jgi:coenzyme F420-0:L-glutamate ligase/coenzyme F420-1:gamma-L-glutamate ligase
MIEIHPLSAIGEVQPGDDLAGLLAEAIKAASLAPLRRDILVVTQKIVSKSEGRFVALSSVAPGARARELAEATNKDPRFVELALMESSAVIRAAPGVLILRHRSGHVMANAGLDRSNLGPGREDCVLLLPEDADASAKRLRAGLAAHWPEPPAVVISDSFGRPWRLGLTGAAIGASGLPALIDRRGEKDRDGRPLEVTQTALGDAVAAAAGLAAGEAAEGVPAALVRGVSWDADENPASSLVRPLDEDLFR